MATTTDNHPTLTDDQLQQAKDDVLARDPIGGRGVNVSPIDASSVKNAARVCVIVSFDDPNDDDDLVSLKLGELTREGETAFGHGRGG